MVRACWKVVEMLFIQITKIMVNYDNSLNRYIFYVCLD